MSTQSLRFSPEHSTPHDVTLLNASSSRYEGDWPSIPHSHAFTELFYVRDGQGEFLIEDNIFPISKDDLIIVNPHINHTGNLQRQSASQLFHGRRRRTVFFI